MTTHTERHTENPMEPITMQFVRTADELRILLFRLAKEGYIETPENSATAFAAQLASALVETAKKRPETPFLGTGNEITSTDTKRRAYEPLKPICGQIYEQPHPPKTAKTENAAALYHIRRYRPRQTPTKTALENAQ